MTEKIFTTALAAALALSLGLVSHGASAQQPAKQPKAAPAKQAAPPAAAQQAPQLKQMALSDKQIEQMLAAQKDVDAIAAKMPDKPGAKPDPKLTGQLEDTAKKYGFASYAEYNDVVDNVGLVMSGFDPQTKSYVGPEAVIKAQIAAIQADKKMAPKDKKAALADLNDALKTPPPAVENKGNIDLVAKNYDKLAAAMQIRGLGARPDLILAVAPAVQDMVGCRQTGQRSEHHRDAAGAFHQQHALARIFGEEQRQQRDRCRQHRRR